MIETSSGEEIYSAPGKPPRPVYHTPYVVHKQSQKKTISTNTTTNYDDYIIIGIVGFIAVIGIIYILKKVKK
jgi:hypothetical protein